jgi:hypothetical protein
VGGTEPNAALGMAEEETIMKMLTIVCREKFKEEMLVLFGTLGIKGTR